MTQRSGRIYRRQREKGQLINFKMMNGTLKCCKKCGDFAKKRDKGGTNYTHVCGKNSRRLNYCSQNQPNWRAKKQTPHVKK